MQQTIQKLTCALLQAAQGGGNCAGAGELHRNFRSLNPPRFSGSMDLDEVEHWLKETERIFRVIQCAAGDKLLLATFQLGKDARSWWESVEATRDNGQFAWAEFREAFNSKYFSKHVQERKASKRFLNGLKPRYITQLAPLGIQTYAEMVKRTQLLEDATDFTNRIKGKFVKKELTPGETEDDTYTHEDGNDQE
ncbi:hypothetical protein Taro_024896 [Colocasia esculenta]|uniref:Retrotransposon gag domain-containing protein n=1 Tax=Colocasia esculenta TaxID=4460 RepID=A0A843VAN5_COLES|nr:hypothetical protein [Colocasia esculenta]